uniref:DNA-directed RNA polymerase subunit gamma n=1 Tax=Drypetes indica TaxID=1679348 RepID=A0A7G8QD24_9ROSI|nr:RNA polymerase beta' subunit [Drypetes indica]QNK04682.1 RNA polymerase beta' subunit [Drypetes indica]
MIDRDKHQQLRIGSVSPQQISAWASKILPNGEIVGEVKNPYTFHFQTNKPEKDGLFCERIFGPIKSGICACGNARGDEEENTNFCKKCGVEFVDSRIRRYQMGYIKLACPVTHVWYLKRFPSYIVNLLDKPIKQLEGLVYRDVCFARPIGKKPTFLRLRGSFEYAIQSWKYSLPLFFNIQGFAKVHNREIYTGAGAIRELLADLDLQIIIDNSSIECKKLARAMYTKKQEEIIDEEIIDEEIIDEDEDEDEEIIDEDEDEEIIDEDEDEEIIDEDEEIIDEEIIDEEIIDEDEEIIDEEIIDEEIIDEEIIDEEIIDEEIIDEEIIDEEIIDEDEDEEIIDEDEDEDEEIIDEDEDEDEEIIDEDEDEDEEIIDEDEDEEIIDEDEDEDEEIIDEDEDEEIIDEDEDEEIIDEDEDEEIIDEDEDEEIIDEEIIDEEIIDEEIIDEEIIDEEIMDEDEEIIDEEIIDEDEDEDEEIIDEEEEEEIIDEDEEEEIIDEEEEEEIIKWGYQRMERRKNFLVRRMALAKHFIQANIKPEWMVLCLLPVLPPELRPIIQIDGGKLISSDLNDLYKRVIYRNNALATQLRNFSPYDLIMCQEKLVQEAVDILLNDGIHGQPMRDGHDKVYKSFSDIIEGKEGRFRETMLGKRVDYSGRSVIVVGPTLSLHQCGLPREIAIELFQPFIIRWLIGQHFASSIAIAKRKIREKDPIVWEILEEVIQGHPVLLNRAPTLHRLGIQAFEPILVEGRAICLHPLVCKGFNADFDGDQMAVHVPLSMEAQVEARLLMCSTMNLLSPTIGDPICVPTQDMLIGLYRLTSGHRRGVYANRYNSCNRRNCQNEIIDHNNDKYPKEPLFCNFYDAIGAYQQKKINLDSPLWLRWQLDKGVITSREAPIEVHYESLGTYHEIYGHYLIVRSIKKEIICIYIRTTVGHIYLYQKIEEAIQGFYQVWSDDTESNHRDLS